MNKNVILQMKSIQTAGDEKSETELTTDGKYSAVDGGYQVTYSESEATGFEGSDTVMTCLGNESASICRKGSFSSQLMLETGKKHFCHYGTPYGEFVVGINTHLIDNKLTDNGGDVFLKYTIDINSSYVSDNEIRLNIKMAD